MHQAAGRFVKAAQAGHADALLEAGKAFAAGAGVPQDRITAAMLLRLATNAGNEEAQAVLAELKLPQAEAGIADALAAKWEPGKPFPTRENARPARPGRKS